jgi:hypothetical protein
MCSQRVDTSAEIGSGQIQRLILDMREAVLEQKAGKKSPGQPFPGPTFRGPRDRTERVRLGIGSRSLGCESRPALRHQVKYRETLIARD